MSFLSKTILLCAAVTILASPSKVQACGGSDNNDTAIILDAKTAIFKKMLNTELSSQMNVLNQAGENLKNNACKYSLLVTLGLLIGLGIHITNDLDRDMPNCMADIFAITAVAIAAPATALVTTCIATKVIRAIGSMLENKSSLYVPTTIALIHKWDSIKAMIPKEFSASFEQLAKHYKKNSCFTPADEEVINQIFDQFIVS